MNVPILIMVAAFINEIGFMLCLRDVKVAIPIAVQRSENVQLNCQFDLEGDYLYSVKWYKGRREFFRFTPKETPSIKTFPIHTVQVSEPFSNMTHVVLENVQFSTSGKYSCEVSADAPSFHTALVSGDLNVVDVPKENPVINGIRHSYRIGDIIGGNCSSRSSRPAANLTWFINNNPANNHYLGEFKIQKRFNGYEASHLDLQFILSKRHFIDGRLKIRCTANVYNLYWRTVEKSLELEQFPSATQEPSPSIIPHIFQRTFPFHFNGYQIEVISSSSGRNFGHIALIVLIHICITL